MSDHDVVSIPDAAAECGVTVAEYISQLVDAGMLLVIPGTEDERCGLMFDGIRWHVDYCACRFVPAPHPDITEMK